MAWSPPMRIERWVLKPIVFVGCLVPFILLVIGFFRSTLGFNPVEIMTHETGQWGLRFLLGSLAITPMKTLTGMSWLIRFRRMIGLYAFFYAVLHFSVYFLWDQSLNIRFVVEDVIERPYITLGFFALVLMIPLAITSTNKMRRRLKQRWMQLHLLTYPIGLLTVLHFIWLTKADYLEPGIYAAVFGFLMLFRVKDWIKKPVFNTNLKSKKSR